MQDKIGEAHRDLDATVDANAFTVMGGFSTKKAAEQSGIPRATFQRLQKGNVSKNLDVSNLTTKVLKKLYLPSDPVAFRCQMMERKLRLADLGFADSRTAISLLDEADAVVMSAETELRAGDETGELALASLKVQIALYRARGHKGAAKARLLKMAHDILARNAPRLVRIVLVETLQHNPAVLISIRMLINWVFAAWELDEVDGEGPKKIPAVVAAFNQPGFMRHARAIAAEIRDPRIAYQLAEVAALGRQHYSAMELLSDAIAMTGGDPRDPLLWKPVWLPVPLASEPHFAPVIELMMKHRPSRKESMTMTNAIVLALCAAAAIAVATAMPEASGLVELAAKPIHLTNRA